MTVQTEPRRYWYFLPLRKSGHIPPILEVNILGSFNFQLKPCDFQNTSFMQILKIVVKYHLPNF